MNTAKVKDYPETHQQGLISLENLEKIKQQPLSNADFGVQIATDGRVWICINGIAFIRFKPNTRMYDSN